jgi:hypothetical protein
MTKLSTDAVWDWDYCAQYVHDQVMNHHTVDQIVTAIEGGTDYTLRRTHEFVIGWIEGELEITQEWLDNDDDERYQTIEEAEHYRKVLEKYRATEEATKR